MKIALSEIRGTHNPRNPLPQLQAALASEGYEDQQLLDLVHNLALSDDETKRTKFVKLIEKYESSIVELAASRRHSAIQPIMVRIVDEHYALVVGERRLMAAAYNHAKHGDEAVIEADVRELDTSEAYRLAVDENLQRKEMTDLEIGEIFATYTRMINPETGKKYNLRQVAAYLNQDYQFVRGRTALTTLDEKDKRRLESGSLGVTAAIQKALASKKGEEVEAADKKVNRARVLTLRAVQALFDATEPDQEERLRTLAEVMQITLKQAKAESKVRVKMAEADLDDAA